MKMTPLVLVRDHGFLVAFTQKLDALKKTADDEKTKIMVEVRKLEAHLEASKAVWEKTRENLWNGLEGDLLAAGIIAKEHCDSDKYSLRLRDGVLHLLEREPEDAQRSSVSDETIVALLNTVLNSHE